MGISSNGSTIAVDGTLVLSGTGAVADQSSNQVFALESGGLLDLRGTGSIRLWKRLTLDPNSTVQYSSSGAQSVSNAATYGHLKVLNGNTKTAAGALTITGDFTVGTGTTFVAGNVTHNLQGDFSNSGTYTAGTGTANLNGSSTQIDHPIVSDDLQQSDDRECCRRIPEWRECHGERILRSAQTS